MSNVSHYIRMLQDKDHNKRYEACEELRVSTSPLPQEALDALAIAKNDKNPDVADAARRALEFHTPSTTKPKIDAQEGQTNNNANRGKKFLGGYLVFIILIVLICGITQGGDGLGLILAFVGGPLLIIALIVGGLGFYVSETVGNKKSQPSTNRASNTKKVDGNSLEKFIEKIDFSKLTEKPDYYYKTGVAFIEKGQYDDGIIEFTKVIKITSVEDELHAFAQKELENMGFSKTDIDGIRKQKTA